MPGLAGLQSPPDLPIPFGPSANIAAARPGGSKLGHAMWKQDYGGKSAWRRAALLALRVQINVMGKANTSCLLVTSCPTCPALITTDHGEAILGGWRNPMCCLPAASESPAVSQTGVCTTGSRAGLSLLGWGRGCCRQLV